MYRVALCCLTARDERLIEIVVARTPNPKYRYVVGAIATLGDAQIAVVDAASAHHEGQLAESRRLNPGLVAVYVSDLGLSGASRYRIERRSLLLRITRVLDEVVEQELLGTTLPKVPTSVKSETATVQRKIADTAVAGGAVGLKSTSMQPLRALIVDDSLGVRELLRSALERAGIISDEAENAESAWVQLRTNVYDLVFLDVVMPGADGYEVCRSIKKNAYTRNLPVLMLTSRSSPFDRARGALAGCDSYLVKPFTWETFFTALDKVLSKYFRHDLTLLNARGYKARRVG